jgi:hypothetical protein
MKQIVLVSCLLIVFYVSNAQVKKVPTSKNTASTQVSIPITLKPNTFTAIESMYYKIFNLIVSIPFTLLQYDKITGHSSYLLKPIVLKYYMIIFSILNLLSYLKINNQLMSRTLERMGTFFPLLLTLVFTLSIIL